MTEQLFTPIQLGQLHLKNRMVMAPLTRARSSEGHMPNALMAEYYAQRASAGLLITECTMAFEQGSAFINEPGIYNDAQVEAWKEITHAVHAQGGTIVMQIWHAGRAAHPDLNGGATPVSASGEAIRDEVHTLEGKKPYTAPKVMDQADIETAIGHFKTAAANAKRAGFDGVEVHGANGYLIDQFLRDTSNQRTDAYGGSLENRARFLFEVLDAVTDVWGSERVGLRLSPLNSYNDMKDSDPAAWMAWLAEHLSPYNLAYLHVMRGDFFSKADIDVLQIAHDHYSGNIMTNMGYDAEEAEATLQAGLANSVAFGVPFLANPDLPRRFQEKAELNKPRPAFFYTPGPEGYTDYPTL